MGGATEDEIRRLVSAVDYSEALTIVAGEAEVREACRQARRYGFRAVVAFPQFLPVLVDQLQGSGVLAQIPVGFPCGALTDEEKAVAAKMVVDSGAEFIKTCTGWDSGRATAGDIALIRKAAGPEIGIKASGGVGTIAAGVALMRAGATVVAMRRSLVDQLEARHWPGH